MQLIPLDFAKEFVDNQLMEPDNENPTTEAAATDVPQEQTSDMLKRQQSRTRCNIMNSRR